MESQPTKPRVIIHGGAGNITREYLPPKSYQSYRASLLIILRYTEIYLARGANALDAATYAVRLLEDNPLFNCGHGAVFTRTGTIELEASVMVSRGYQKRGVAVSLLKHVKNPILLAREMLRKGEEDNGGGAQGHSHLSGRAAEDLAEDWGLDMVDEKYFWTRKRWDEHKKGLENEGIANESVSSWPELSDDNHEWHGDPSWDGHEYLPQGTVGCVVLDKFGVLCTATSTGGLTNKLPGRIGDTPTLGAGFWAEQWTTPSLPDLRPQQSAHASSPLNSILPQSVKANLSACLPQIAHYAGIQGINEDEDASLINNNGSEKAGPAPSSRGTRAAALSGTGNGDSFLRIAAVRTAIAACRFGSWRSLQKAVTDMAGPGGELQQSAGDRWGKTGEGQGGMIGIEVFNGQGKIAADFNCGGMFRAWVDDAGQHRMMVFRDEYKV